ncbi:MAG: ATP-dependent RNA helicase RhlE [Parcubacteria group bacterium Gr01-1014_29]|nr:MAG: ATP-dependent RNA helicase RhlE [Parcubacteria group bacterium Gr01-1014_29]
MTQETPIQHQSIPAAIEGKDIIGIAQTGTGKTLAFGIPMIQRIAEHRARGLVVLPTRELALQVNDMLQKIGHPLGLRTAVLIGGESMPRQIDQLRQGPHIIIATPGRLIDHLGEKTVSLGNITILVLDEADRMFDMGFAPQIRIIFEALPEPGKRQTMLFSATMPDTIVSIATRHMTLPVRVEVAPAGTTIEATEQEIYIVKKESKISLLETLLREHAGTILIFSRTKHGASKLARHLRDIGERAVEIHSNKTMGQRREALEGFKKGKYRVLVATDIAARGINVVNIELVVNFDIPESSEDYVHRIGRTGRAGREGKAISLATPDQQGEIRAIERLIRKTLLVKRHESVSEELLALQKVMRPRPRGRTSRHQQSASWPTQRSFSPRSGGPRPFVRTNRAPRTNPHR